MQTAPHVAAIQAALEAVAGDDPAAGLVAQRLSAVVAPALQLQVLDLLGQVALEVNEQLPGGRVDVQLAGRDAVLVYRDDAAPAPEPPPAAEEEAGTARLTLRMAEPLKTAVEAAATQAGTSTNQWLVNAARLALQPPARRGAWGRAAVGSRLSGYAHS